jgi:hypothetical protein
MFLVTFTGFIVLMDHHELYYSTAVRTESGLARWLWTSCFFGLVCFDPVDRLPAHMSDDMAPASL